MEGLLGYLQEKKGLASPSEYLFSGVDIEALHSEIEQARDEIMARSSSYIDFYYEGRAYNELVYLFASVLNEIQSGPPSEPHLKLACWLNPEDVVVTFNWDTLMDRALSLTTDWAPDWGYGVKPARVFRDGWEDPKIRPDKVRAPALIKLHGSTNWLTSHPGRDLKRNEFIHTHATAPEAFALFETATQPYSCFAGRYMGPHEPYAYGYYPPNLDFEGKAAPTGHKFVRVRPKVPWKPEGAADDAGLVSIPLIIPPVRHKSYDHYGPLFRDLWRAAETGLTAADQIIIVGYSFPPTDHQAVELFRKAFAARASMPSVTLVDPSPERAAETLTMVLGIDDQHLKVLPQRFDNSTNLHDL